MDCVVSWRCDVAVKTNRFMKIVKCISILCLAVATAGVVLAVVNQKAARKTEIPPDVQRYHVRGEVRGIDAESKQIRIKHEEIPNYMAAMTMPFDIRDTALLGGLRAGDEVGFELVVTEDDSWIASIQKLSEGTAPAGESNSDRTNNSVRQELQRVQVGERVPNFTLTDQNSGPVNLSDFRGKVVLLTFIYTRCPLPNFCPLMSKNFASLQERLEKRFPGKFQLLSVSIDPEFDRPEILKEYAKRYTEKQATWTYGTGTTEQTDSVGAMFGLVQERVGGLVNHDLRTAVIGPDGRLVHLWKSNVWTPYEVERRVEELLSR
jgi:protein SCO1